MFTAEHQTCTYVEWDAPKAWATFKEFYLGGTCPAIILLMDNWFCIIQRQFLSCSMTLGTESSEHGGLGELVI